MHADILKISKPGKQNRLKAIGGAAIAVAAAAAAFAATGTSTASAAVNPYMHGQTVIGCTTYVYPNRTIGLRQVTVSTPTVNSPFLPTMNVSWQPILYRYTARGWVRIATGPELWGSTAFGTMTTQSFGGWNVTAGNVWYHVNVVYRWYRNGVVYTSQTDRTSTHINWATAMRYDGTVGIGVMGPTGSSCLMDA